MPDREFINTFKKAFLQKIQPRSKERVEIRKPVGLMVEPTNNLFIKAKHIEAINKTTNKSRCNADTQTFQGKTLDAFFS